MKIMDNGSGFNPDQFEDIPSSAFGIFSLREKALMIGGMLVITSTLGRGTKVTFTIPVDK